MIAFLRKHLSPFTFLNITQFLGALNDNIFKMLLIFMLIDLQGVKNSPIILSISGAAFVLPFLLFSEAAGTLADRISKRNIAVFTKYLELFIMLLGVIAFSLKNANFSYFVLFMMGAQSAIFGPSKYGIVSELVKIENISKANGLLTMFTYLAIVMGTFLASFMTDYFNRNFIVTAIICSIISLLGVLSSHCIKKTPPAGGKKKITPFFLYEIIKTLILSKKYNNLITAIFGSAFLTFLGAYIQLNIIPFSMETLHLTDTQGGYLFLLTALGIGTGSMIAAKISGKEVELGLVPLGGIGITICCFLLHAFSSQLYVVIPLIAIVGIFGGIYVIPMDTFVQVASPHKNRGAIIAAHSFVSFLGVLFAAATIFIFDNKLGLKPDEGFAMIGFTTLIVVIFITFSTLDYYLRFIAFIISKLFFNVTINGNKNLTKEKASIFIAKESSWKNALLLLATQRRGTRFLIECKKKHFFWLAPLYRLIRIIPFKNTDNPFRIKSMLKDINKSLHKGVSICIYLNKKEHREPKDIRFNVLYHIITKTTAPLVPIVIKETKTPKEQKIFFREPLKRDSQHIKKQIYSFK